MKSRRTTLVLTAALALALPLTVWTDDRGGNNDQNKDTTPQDARVDFGDPITLVGAGNQVLVPDDTTIRKGGTITFVVNGGGHGIAIYPVSENTTREDITQQLCAHDPTGGLHATSTQIGDLAGVFLTGSTATTAGTQLQFRFDKTGRYLAVCMNRNHYLASWMFGFVNVVGGKVDK